MTAACHGSLIAFQNNNNNYYYNNNNNNNNNSNNNNNRRTLYVRSAGEDAWLGLPAPEDPILDAIDNSNDNSNNLFLIDNSNNNNESSVNGFVNNNNNKTSSRRSSFRSFGEAVLAANDNDTIVLLRGVHNVGGEAIHINKR